MIAFVSKLCISSMQPVIIGKYSPVLSKVCVMCCTSSLPATSMSTVPSPQYMLQYFNERMSIVQTLVSLDVTVCFKTRFTGSGSINLILNVPTINDSFQVFEMVMESLQYTSYTKGLTG